MLRRCFLICSTCLALGFSPITVSAATVFTEDFDSFSNGISLFQAGGNQQQIISSTIGTSQGLVPAISGTSFFLTIDTTNTPPVGSGSYGGGLQTIIDAPFTAGNFTSTNASDYDLVFDIAANGFSPNNMDIFLQFRNSTNDNVLGTQLSINQNNPVLGSFVSDLGATDGPVSVSIGLEEFTGLPADISGLINADRIQFQLFTRSLDANYSADDGNVLVLDNIGISVSAVPEPTSAAMLLAGALCFAARRRRRA